LQEKPGPEESLIISFSNLLETTTPDANNLSQVKFLYRVEMWGGGWGAWAMGRAL
jgi:hypothetical protein